MLKRLSASEWKRSGTPRDALLLRASPALVAKDGASGQRLTFTISTDSVDREGDTIRVPGWELTNYRKNPVVLFAHDSRRPPVARAVSVTRDGKRLVATVEFPPPGLHPEADLLRQLYARGFMRAVSVGFLPIDWQRSTDPERPNGYDFLRQELLEFSLVPVGANPEALVTNTGRREVEGVSVRFADGSHASLSAVVAHVVHESVTRPPGHVSVQTLQGVVRELFGEVLARGSGRQRTAVVLFLSRFLAELERKRIRVVN